MTVQGGRRSALRGRAGKRRGGLGDWEEAEVSEPSSCNTTKAFAGPQSEVLKWGGES